MKQAFSSVVSNNEVMPGTHFIWLESPQIAAEARPGQFVMVCCGEETLLRRPLSIHLVDGEKMALLFAIVGKGSRWLSQRQIGDNVDIFGPLGNGFSIHPDAKNLLLVAGGIGIAPLPFLADRAKSQGYSVQGVRGAGTAGQLLPDAFLPHVQVSWPAASTLVGDPGTIKGVVTDLLPKYVDWADQVFACGPLPMYKTMAQMPELKGKPVQVSLEIMMGCGRGLCYGCTIRTKQGLKKVCSDGPVFDLDDILWDKLDL